jgi:hypothetical protein
MTTSLPPEIWRTILDYLPKGDRKTCLSVSPLHHHLAASTLFSAVHIYFGTWELSSEGYTRDRDEDPYILEEQAEERSLDILDHISENATFARYVQKVIVHAYARGSSVYHRRR